MINGGFRLESILSDDRGQSRPRSPMLACSRFAVDEHSRRCLQLDVSES